MMVEGEEVLAILCFHPNFRERDTGGMHHVPGAVPLWGMFPCRQLPACCSWGGPTWWSFYMLPGDFSPPGNALLWAQQGDLGSLVTLLPHSGAGGSHPGGRRFFAGELGQWKAISDHLWSASQTCLLVCLSLILTLAFCSWSGWNRFGFGFSSFIIILECHILWNAK